jgi:hypothetical protein
MLDIGSSEEHKSEDNLSRFGFWLCNPLYPLLNFK